MRPSIPSTLTRACGPRGQTIVEFALVFSLILLPLTFMIVFASQMLWVWHSVAEWTRAGAKYAATHCFQSDGENVKQWMRNNVPPMVDINKFRDGEVDINVDYFSQDPATGDLTAFTCSGTECSPECVPDAVHVSVSNYEFTRFFNVLGLPPVPIPDFSTAVSMEGAGCNPEQQTCLP
ncbi:MAG TPA: TadE family protein [Bryobacterales bacterium]|nr:TadE family protein [Bryobacterales bacterium]